MPDNMDDGDVVYPPESWMPRPDQMGVWTDLECNKPNVLVIAHRQWGKDELFLRDCCIHAMEKAANYVYCLPQTEHVRKSIWDAINPDTGIKRIDEAFPPEIRARKLEDRMMLEIPTVDGKVSNVLFTGSDNYTALRGMVGYIYYFSEWAFCDPGALGVIRPIVNRNGGMMRFITTSFGENHAYKMLIENAGNPRWGVHLITNNAVHPLSGTHPNIHHGRSHAISADMIREATIENIQIHGAEVGPAVTTREYECTFEEIVAGSYYLDLLLKLERDGRIMNLPHRQDLPVYAAFDIGFSDPTAIWYVRLVEEGWYDFIDYDEITRVSVAEWIPDIKSKPWYYGSLLLPHDGPHHEVTSGTTTMQILEAAGFDVKPMPQTSDKAQIPSVRNILPRCRFANTPAVRRGLECLRHYHGTVKREGDRTTHSPKPVHDWSSHACKALSVFAYFAGELRSGVQPPKQPAKDLFTNRQYSYEGGAWMR